MKNIFLSLTFVIFFFINLLFFAGCEKIEPKPVTLKFMHNRTDSVWVNYLKGFVMRYEKSNPHITIKYEAVAGDKVLTKMGMGLKSMEGPDVIGCALSHITKFVSDGVIQDLNEYVNNWDSKEDILESMLNAVKLEDKWWGLAYYSDPYIMAYRTDYFIEAGLDPENPPKTWEELADYSVKLTVTKDGVITRSGFQIPIDDNTIFIPLAIQGGAQFLTEDSKPTFNTPPWQEALSYLTDLYKNKKVSSQTYIKTEWKEHSFTKGEAAMGMINPGQIKAMLNKNPELKDKIRFFRIKRKVEANWSGSWLIAMGKNSENKEEAWKMIDAFMSKIEIWIRYQETNCPVARKSLFDQFIDADPFLNQTIFEGIEKGVANPMVPWAKLQIASIRNAMLEAFLGDKTPQAALEDNYNILVETLKEKGYW